MSAKEGFTIREYQPGDRDAVRWICFATGYMGEPIDWQWRDMPSFADLFSGYYTDHEPGSSFVGEVGGRVAGYLLGCEDTSKVSNLATVAVRHALGRMLLVRPGTAGVMRRMVTDTVVDAVRNRSLPPPPAFLDARWPAHLHVDLLPEARGMGMGAALVRGWLSRLRATGSRGCHIETLAENERAVRFFGAMGFARHGEPVLVPGLRQRDGGRLHLLRMVQSLDGTRG